MAAIDAQALRRHAIHAGDILLFLTDNSERWAKAGFQKDFTYVTRDAAEHLVERKVRTIGMDYLSIEEFGSKTFEVHKLLLGAGIFIIEGLDLREIAAGPYLLSCLPLKLEGVDGKAFFEQTIKDMQQGFFADPIYGGNRDMAGWRMIGYPGSRYNYLDWVHRHNERFPLPPVSMTGRADWTPKTR